jgi:hypothetical protein
MAGGGGVEHARGRQLRRRIEQAGDDQAAGQGTMPSGAPARQQIVEADAPGGGEGRRDMAVRQSSSASEFWPRSADGFWLTSGPSTYGSPTGSGDLAWTGEPKWICSSSFVGSMSLGSARSRCRCEV